MLFSGRELDWGSAEKIILISLLDITDRKNALNELERYNVALEQRVRERTIELTATNQELEAFCYSVAHDLRNPLRGIEGFSRVLAKDYADRLDAKGKGYFERIRAAIYRMSHLIDSLLDLARLTRSEMQREEVDLSLLVGTISEELKNMHPERQVEVVVAPGLKTMGDTRLLRIALTNLLENSWKFTTKHPLAKIEFGMTQENNEPVYFIRDDGAGFDTAFADKLFQTFQRLHSLEEFPGTGIGLTIAQRIIKRHGGRIWAEGAVEHGATFYFSLSLPNKPSPNNHEERRSVLGGRRKEDRRRIDA
jgi:light-regulated signal transduction histidine kinase (bacteriophytochrome)